jgi:alpha-1,6-mannosyltransferase
MGIDFDHLSPNRRSPPIRRQLLKKFPAPEKSVLLLYVGRLVPEKNLALLFEVLDFLAKDKTRDFRLLVVGDGVERSRWERKCQQELPGRAVFVGHIKDHAELADIYGNCDVFVHPNPREPFGIAPLEAMASGLPLVAPNAGGVTSYANLENAWTIDADVASFAAAIENVITNQELTARKIANALLTAAQYGWDAATASFLDLYTELHQAAHAKGEGIAPAFWSTKAQGLQAASFHGVSQVAQKIFAMGTRLSKNTPRHHLTRTKTP